MALMNCEECGETISTKASACVHCGTTISDKIKDKGGRLDNNEETIIATYEYSMLRAGPLWMLIFVVMIIAYGTGIVFLAGWSFIMSPRPLLIVTDRALIYKDSSFKKHTIYLYEIDNITAGASVLQKIIGSGYLLIKKKGLLRLPLLVNGLQNPQLIKKLIISHRN